MNYFSWVLLLSFSFHLTSAFPTTGEEVGSEPEELDDEYEDDEDDEWVWTEHRRMEDSLYVDVTADDSVDLSRLDPSMAAEWVASVLGESLTDRLTELLSRTTTSSCRATVAEHLGYFVGALAEEEAMPFSKLVINNTCPEPVYEWNNLPEGMHLGHVQNRSYQPPRDEAVYLEDQADLKLLYAVLTHEDAPSTIRLVEALYEPGHIFVIHVDAKEHSEATHQSLKSWAGTLDYVHLLEHPYRVRVNWGGFSMVNATLQMLHYSFGLLSHTQPLDFHKVVHIASTSYPLASKTEIRNKIASFPLDANFLHVIMKASRPSAWSYFVECDDALHRIYHLPVPTRETAGFDLFTASQWWIFSREFAQYIAEAKPGTFVHQFLEYAEHTVIADETFFGTVIRNTEFCLKHHNRNYLHLQFDRWESDLPSQQRDERKCMMKDPDHCGRSPTTMTVDYAPILELSDDLFARKFLDSVDSTIKNIVDQWREKRELEAIPNLVHDADQHSQHSKRGLELAGHGVLIVAKDTVNDPTPLCLGLGMTGNNLRLEPCFHDWVPSNLVEGWESGAVIQEETLLHNRWDISPCTTDGRLERLDNGAINVTRGNYSSVGPHCMLKQMDGVRAGRCFDGDTAHVEPGGPTVVFPCVHRWGQFVSLGDGILTPVGSIFFTMPRYVLQHWERKGRVFHPYLCLSIPPHADFEHDGTTESQNGSLSAVAKYVGQDIHATACTDDSLVLKWVFVPYILEDPPEESDADSAAANTSEIPVTPAGEPERKSILNTTEESEYCPIDL